jgi:hypothetical protein
VLRTTTSCRQSRDCPRAQFGRYLPPTRQFFCDLIGDVRNEQHYFDGLISLHGEEVREDVMCSIYAAHDSGDDMDNFEENVEEELDENLCLTVGSFRSIGESEDHDDSVKAAIYNTAISPHTTSTQMSDDSDMENEDNECCDR